MSINSNFNALENSYLEPNDEPKAFCECDYCHDDIMVGEDFLVTGTSHKIHEDCFKNYFMEECYIQVAE